MDNSRPNNTTQFVDARASAGAQPSFMRAFQSILLRQNHRVVFFALALIVGIMAGAGAAALKWMISGLSRSVTAHLSLTHFNWWLIIVPTIGLLLTALLLKLAFGHNINHGVSRMIGSIKLKRYYLNPRLLFGPMLASTLTLGFGGSAGSEGPIASTGAAIGSNVGRWCGLTSEEVGTLLCCGAGAGIAGIFCAPIGGVLFALEVLGAAFSTATVLALVASCLAAGITALVLRDFQTDIAFNSNEAILALADYWWVVAIGLLCGLYATYYATIMKRLGHKLDKMKTPRRIALAGAISGILLMLFPALYGEGYQLLDHVINGEYENIINGSVFTFAKEYTPLIILLAAGCVALVKAFATASATCGGVAGDFAPALFAGGCSGLTFALLLNMIPGADINVGIAAYLGMAAVMSGAVKAPLMAIFLVMEMAGAYHLMLPLTIVSLLSISVRKLLESHIATENAAA